jgi:predicted Zn-dependent peptidase
MLALVWLFVSAPVLAQSAGLKLPPYKKLQLKNGMTVLLMEQTEVPVVSFSFIIRAGSVSDPVGKEGVASLTAGLLRKGTKNRTADQLSNELDFIGGSLGFGAGTDFTSGSAEFIKKDLDKGLDLVADTLLNPTFPDDEVKKLLTQSANGVKAAKDNPQAVIGQYYNRYLFGSHPYGRPSGGDETSLAAITRDDIVKFYNDKYKASNTILAVAGDFNTAEMEAKLNAKFGAWAGDAPLLRDAVVDKMAKPKSGKKPMAGPPPTAAQPVSNVPAPQPFVGKKLLLVDKPNTVQTYFYIGNVGVSRANPDRVGINVVNTLFGGRFTSMLNSELRIKTGLTYGARSFFDQRAQPGAFAISTYTRTETTEKALDLALDILKRLHEKGVTEEELKSGKEYIKGQFPTSVETTDQLARALANFTFYGLTDAEINDYYTKIDAMTVAEANRIIKQYYPLDNLVFVLVGKGSEISKVAQKYAPKVDTKAITETGF